MPLICETDEIERKARQGSNPALRKLMTTLPIVKRRYVERLIEQGMSEREAFTKSGIAICIR